MKSYDQKINKFFYYWLLLSFFMVFIMIIVGGLTRLTDSGLSITEWELFKGIFPPLNDFTWNQYFSLYKQIPQYRLINSNMSLDQFKVIFYWEYFHRMLGRVIGLSFLVSFIYFYFKKQIDRKYLSICFLILILIILQGILGWYMVQSGLTNDVTVSHYRLSLHLSLAFIIISIIFWNLLNFRRNNIKNFFIIKKENFIFYFLIFLIFLQIALGAFVSGLDAGKIYQTWPLMDNNYFPSDTLIFSIKDIFNFENQGLTQFYHRNLAYLILFYSLAVGFFVFKEGKTKLIKSFYLLSLLLTLQVFLGIMTLITGLNIVLASAHQICSVLLMLSSINLYYNYIN